MIRRLLRPLRLGLGKLGLKVTMLKNPGERGYTGFNTEGGGPSPEKFRRCGLATFKHEVRDIRFLIQDEDDIIQQELIAGRFYEQEELAIIARHFTGGTFVDVGGYTVSQSLRRLAVASRTSGAVAKRLFAGHLINS